MPNPYEPATDNEETAAANGWTTTQIFAAMVFALFLCAVLFATVLFFKSPDPVENQKFEEVSTGIAAN